MNLYQWDSTALERCGSGRVVVMAFSVEEARQKAINAFEHLASSHNDCVIEIFGNYHDPKYDPDFNEDMSKLRQKLLTDIAIEPEQVLGGVLFIEGSE